MSVDKNWFTDCIRNAGYTQNSLAIKMGIDRGGMSRMLNGGRKMSVSEAITLSRLLGVSAAKILEKADVVNPQHATDEPTDFLKEVKNSRKLPAKRASLSIEKPGMFEMPIPLSDQQIAVLKLPRVLTKVDAERISAVVMAFVSGK